jgi:hypothetical protein
VTPGRGSFSSFADVPIALEVEEFVANAAVQALDVSVLGRLAGIAELQDDVVLGRPSQHREASQLRTSIDPKNGGVQASLERNGIENTDHLAARKRELDFERKLLSRKVVHDIERAEPASREKGVVKKIKGPALIRSRCKRAMLATNMADMAFTQMPNLQRQRSIDTNETPFAHAESLALYEEAHAAPAEPRPLRRDGFHGLE